MRTASRTPRDRGTTTMRKTGGERRAPGRAVVHVVDYTLAGQRLDRIVAALHPELSRAAAHELIESMRVLIDGRPAKPAARPVAGARLTVEVPPPPSSTAEPEQIPLDIVYEDEHLVIVNKPAGMVVHPAPGNQHGTLVNALVGRYSTLPGDAMRPGIVHRLDKDTSGLLVVARTPQAIATLAGEFKHREVHKEYLALVVGTPQPARGTITAPIGRDPRFRQRMAIVAVGGRDARTAYITEELFKGYALLRVFPESGRMHQIRVHLSAAGHPIVGDSVYGRTVRALPLRRQFLHAARLRLIHPATGVPLEIEAPLPPDLRDVLAALRIGST